MTTAGNQPEDPRAYVRLVYRVPGLGYYVAGTVGG